MAVEINWDAVALQAAHVVIAAEVLEIRALELVGVPRGLSAAADAESLCPGCFDAAHDDEQCFCRCWGTGPA